MNSSDLFVRSRDAWLLGRWSFLRALTVECIQEHAARADLAALVASAWQQANNIDNVKLFVSLALEWGCSRYFISQLLVAGVYNTLGSVKALQGDVDVLSAFKKAVDIEGFSGLNSSVLASSRMREQLRALDGVNLSACFSLENSFYNKAKEAVTSVSLVSSAKEMRDHYQLVVLGMHRSGTSCVTNLLRSMGAYFGPSDISTGHSDENPKGFWERRDMRNITDSLLFSVDADWYKVSGFYPERIPGDTLYKALSHFENVLDDLNQKPVWVLKEPRLCLLLPVLRSHLKRPLAVCVYRNPLEVALSLQKRNGFSLEFGLALWEFYTISMLRNTSDMDRVFISYNKLIDNPVEGATAIEGSLRTLGVPLTLPEDVELLQIVDGGLYRNKFYAYDMESILTVSQFRLFNRLHGAVDFFNESISDFQRERLAVLGNFS